MEAFENKSSVWFYTLWLIALTIMSVQAQDPIQMCPSHLATILKRIGSCDSIQCRSGLTEKTCQAMGAIYEEGAELCGCCPGCVKYEKGN